MSEIIKNQLKYENSTANLTLLTDKQKADIDKLAFKIFFGIEEEKSVEQSLTAEEVESLLETAWNLRKKIAEQYPGKGYRATEKFLDLFKRCIETE